MRRTGSERGDRPTTFLEKNRSSLWLWLALVTAAVLRFAALGAKTLWYDELASLQR